MQAPDTDISSEFFDEESLIQWYVAVRAAELFKTKNGGRYPGQTTNWQDDVENLK